MVGVSACYGKGNRITEVSFEIPVFMLIDRYLSFLLGKDIIKDEKKR